MDRDTFSHIRLWCPRPFGTYSQNKARSPGSAGGGGGGGAGTGSPPLCKADPSPDARRSVDGAEDGAVVAGGQDKSGDGVGSENTPPEPKPVSSPLPQAQAPVPSGAPPPGASSPQMEDGRVLLDTWYVIKPGNTKEKIAFFVAHQFSGADQPRPSAMKVGRVGGGGAECLGLPRTCSILPV